MKIKIRNSVFETNSSSMHSICILKNPKSTENFSKLGIYDERLDYYSSEDFYFGRSPFEVLNTPRGKIRYLFANMTNCEFYNEENSEFKEVYEAILKAIQTKYSECKKINLPKEYYGDDKEEKICCGYDEDSWAFHELLKKRKLPLEEFIFNPKYIVVIDGDEYNIFGDLIDIGAIDMNNIEEIIPS